LADDRDDLARATRIDKDQCLAAEAVEVLLDDATHEECGNARIKRIAAPRQDLKGGRGRQRDGRSTRPLCAR
jgi:hypothetical protein